LLQQGVIHPASGTATYFPAAGVDSSGDLGVTYMQSSTSQYVSMYVAGRLASDPAGTLETPVLAVAGTAIMTGRTGDYAAICPDTSAARTFWAGNEYAGSGGAWATGIAEFTFSGGGGVDSPPAVATAAAATPSPILGTTTALSVL